MSFLDKVGKGLGKAARKAGKELGEAADRAKFETEKAIKVSRLETELGDLENSLAPVFTSIGQKVSELQASGQLNIPGLDAQFAQIAAARASIKTKKAELDAVNATHFIDPDSLPAHQPAGAAPAPAAQVAQAPLPPVPQNQTPQAVLEKVCPQCGAAVAGSKFCPSCGQKIE